MAAVQKADTQQHLKHTHQEVGKERIYSSGAHNCANHEIPQAPRTLHACTGGVHSVTRRLCIQCDVDQKVHR